MPILSPVNPPVPSLEGSGTSSASGSEVTNPSPGRAEVISGQQRGETAGHAGPASAAGSTSVPSSTTASTASTRAPTSISGSGSKGTFDTAILPSDRARPVAHADPTSGGGRAGASEGEGVDVGVAHGAQPNSAPNAGPSSASALKEHSFASQAERLRREDASARIWDCTDILSRTRRASAGPGPDDGPGRGIGDSNRDRAPGPSTIPSSDNDGRAGEREGTGPGRYALIILNQPIPTRAVFESVWRASRIRICADGGANRLHDALGPAEREEYLPDMIKGDLDSLRDDVRAFYSERGVEVKQDKDEYSTDLMKCIEEIEHLERTGTGTGASDSSPASGSTEGEATEAASCQGITAHTQAPTSSHPPHPHLRARTDPFPLILLGGLSGRVDQTVHTMALLHKLCANPARPEVYVVSDDSLAWALGAGAHLIHIDHASMGQTCGILPVGVDSAVVRTKGLKWNLDGETSFTGLISTSNHLLPAEPAVYLHTTRPVLWCVEIRH